MQVVIMGCGRVGAQLAGLLSMDAHKVSIIDRTRNILTDLVKTLREKRFWALGMTRKFWKLGIEHADAFASVIREIIEILLEH